MEDSEPVELRSLRDSVGKYVRDVLDQAGPIDPRGSALTVERHQTDDPGVTRYVAMDDKGVAAQVRVQVVRK